MPVQVRPDTVLVGVMVMIAVTGDVPVFDAVNTGMLPVPLAVSPIEVLLFVQL